MVWGIIVLALLGLCILLVIANIVVSKINKSKEKKKGEEDGLN